MRSSSPPECVKEPVPDDMSPMTQECVKEPVPDDTKSVSRNLSPVTHGRKNVTKGTSPCILIVVRRIVMWAMIFICTLVAFGGAVIYLISRVGRFGLVEKLANGKRWISILISTGVCVGFVALISLVMGLVNGIIVTLYLILFWIMCELVLWIWGKLRKKVLKRYYAGVIAIIITAVYLSVGWYQAHRVWKTEYTVETDKVAEDIRIAFIADSHIGTTFDGEGFAQHIEEIQAQNPDMLVIVGDFVDDTAKLSDIKRSCEALGNFKSRYGVFYTFGNHDKGYYSDNMRDYTEEELTAELKGNNVTILQDDVVNLGEDISLVGRKDRSANVHVSAGRASVRELFDKADEERFTVVLDHQPNEYKSLHDVGADLVLSGHTHGGQLIIVKLIQELFKIGGNDYIYGLLKKDGTNYIVTSGISAWAIKFKTGCRSEYVIINVNHR